jgi:hypothetical protein
VPELLRREAAVSSVPHGFRPGASRERP